MIPVRYKLAGWLAGTFQLPLTAIWPTFTSLPACPLTNVHTLNVQLVSVGWSLSYPSYDFGHP